MEPMGIPTIQTSMAQCDLSISWNGPSQTGGSSIQYYQVEAQTNSRNRSSNNGWNELSSSGCGTSSNSSSRRSGNRNSCTVSMSTFKSSPFNLNDGDNIIVRVKAYNGKEWSGYSASERYNQQVSDKATAP